jgi:phosphohistidine phosphatase
MRTLFVMRHAKSDWNADYERDHDRPLNDRGVRSARLMGRVLSAEGRVPQLIMASTAVRARSTAALANEAGNWDAEVVLDADLYGTEADAAVQAASMAPDIERLMLVGHQPAWSIVVSVLTGERVDMKTATVAVVEFDIDEWSGLPGSRGELAATFQPRDYFEGEFDLG